MALYFRAPAQNFARGRRLDQTRRSQLRRHTATTRVRARNPRAYKASVYIEDTDCFSVVYYANYLKYFEPAALDLLGAADCQALFAERGLLLGAESFDTMKFAAPGRLGDDVEVRTTVAGFDGGTLRLDAALVRAGDGALCSCGGLRVGFRLRDDGGGAARAVAEERAAGGGGGGGRRRGGRRRRRGARAAAVERRQPGAVCAAGGRGGAHGRFSLHAAMRYFERTRTGSLGGPAALAELQDAGVRVVVARATNARLLRRRGDDDARRAVRGALRPHAARARHAGRLRPARPLRRHRRAARRRDRHLPVRRPGGGQDGARAGRAEGAARAVLVVEP